MTSEECKQYFELLKMLKLVKIKIFEYNGRSRILISFVNKKRLNALQEVGFADSFMSMYYYKSIVKTKFPSEKMETLSCPF